MSFAKELADNLRAARMRSGYTQAELAQKIGSSASCISMYEGGNRVPNLERMSIISHVLGMSLDDLVPYVPEKMHVDENQINIYDLIGE